MRLFPRLRSIFNNALENNRPVVSAIKDVVVDLVAGGRASGADNPMPPMMKLASIVTMAILGAVDRKFGWGLSELIGTDASTIVYTLLTMYLPWRIPERRSV